VNNEEISMRKITRFKDTVLRSFMLVIVTFSITGELAANETTVPPAIESDAMMQIAVLPSDYPGSWLFAHDANFQSLIAGRVILVDAAADTKEYKGAIGAAQFGSFIESKGRAELYVAETFFSRGTRGERTDVVTVYDKSTLQKIDEILLPGNKRMQIVTNKHTLRLIDDDRFLLVFNFTPASSVTVIDIANRSIVSEIAVPGCTMIYPNGQRSFSSMCGDGSMLSVSLDKDGKERKRAVTASFINVDEDPAFEKPVYIDGVAYFVTYLGDVIPVNMKGPKAEPMSKWSLVSDAERGLNWRPSGWQIVSGQDHELYVIMNAGGFNGSHKSGGENIWVYDLKKQEKVRTITPVTPAFSIELLNSSPVLLAVTNVNMGVDIYETNGVLQRSLSLGDAAMPLLIHAARK
jgi:methylamine dehydrogenase heavy chain